MKIICLNCDFFVFIFISILTDMIGLAVASANLEHFTAMAARKVKGSKQAIALLQIISKSFIAIFKGIPGKPAPVPISHKVWLSKLIILDIVILLHIFFRLIT